jgi:hypothetical protein
MSGQVGLKGIMVALCVSFVGMPLALPFDPHFRIDFFFVLTGPVTPVTKYIFFSLGRFSRSRGLSDIYIYFHSFSFIAQEWAVAELLLI